MTLSVYKFLNTTPNRKYFVMHQPYNSPGDNVEKLFEVLKEETRLFPTKNLRKKSVFILWILTRENDNVPIKLTWIFYPLSSSIVFLSQVCFFNQQKVMEAITWDIITIMKTDIYINNFLINEYILTLLKWERKAERYEKKNYILNLRVAFLIQQLLSI